MARESEVFNKEVATFATSKIGLTSFIQDTNITFLRQYFKTMKPMNTQNPIYDQDIIATNIQVEGEFPRRQVSYPLVVVSTMNRSQDLMNKLIGRELYTPLYDKTSKKKIGYSMAGTFTTGFSISVASESTAERRDLLDLIVMLYRTIGSDYLKKFRVNITGMSYGSGRTELLANDLIYFDTLNLTVQTEWKQVIQNIPLITSINVDEVTVAEEEPIF
jgi:hypothetical protein